MPQWSVDGKIYLSAIRIKCIKYLDQKERNKKNTTKMHARRFKFSPLQSALYG
jgi:hypothetical protein